MNSVLNRSIVLSFSAWVMLLFCCSHVAAQSQIQWLEDVDQARELARREGKLVLVHFWNERCGPCKRLDTFVFNHPDVARAVHAAYVPVKVNTFQNPKLTRELKVDRIPQDVFMTADGTVLTKQISPPKANHYSALMEAVAARAGQAASPNGTGNALSQRIASQTRVGGFQGSSNSVPVVDPQQAAFNVQSPQNNNAAAHRLSDARNSEVAADQVAVRQSPEQQVGSAASAPTNRTLPNQRIDAESELAKRRAMGNSRGQYLSHPAQQDRVTAADVQSGESETRRNPFSTTARASHQQTAGAPQQQVTGVTQQQVPAAPQQQITGPTHFQRAGTSYQQSAGYPGPQPNSNLASGQRFSNQPQQGLSAQSLSAQGQNQERLALPGSGRGIAPTAPGQTPYAANTQRSPYGPANQQSLAYPRNPNQLPAAPGRAANAAREASPSDRNLRGPGQFLQQGTVSGQQPTSAQMQGQANRPAQIQNNSQFTPSQPRPNEQGSGQGNLPVNPQGLGSQQGNLGQESQAQTPTPADETEAPAAEQKAELPPVGLEGYCPVTLVEHRVWQKGNKDFGCIHRGRLYFFAAAGLRDRFMQQPDRFAPMLSGYDPVIFLEQQQLVSGKREHGVFFADRVYMFDSEETLNQFRSDVDRFMKITYEAMGLEAPLTAQRQPSGQDIYK